MSVVFVSIIRQRMFFDCDWISILVMTFLIGFFFFFQAEDGIRDLTVTGVQTCALPISHRAPVSVALPELATHRGELPIAEQVAEVTLMRVIGRLDLLPAALSKGLHEIGRASCRERV